MSESSPQRQRDRSDRIQQLQRVGKFKTPAKRGDGLLEPHLHRQHGEEESPGFNQVDGRGILDDEITDAVVQNLRRINLPGFRIIRQQRNDLRQQCDAKTQRRHANQKAVPRYEALVDFRFTGFGDGRRGGNPVHHHRHQRDHDSGQQALAELGLAHGRENLPADVGGTADDRGNDNHRKSRHRGLIDAEQNLAQGTRCAHAPKQLAWRGARHHTRLDHFPGYLCEAQHRVAHGWRKRIKHAGNQADHRTETKQQQNRQQVGEGRDGLQQVHGRRNDALGPLRIETECAETESDRDCHRYGYHH